MVEEERRQQKKKSVNAKKALSESTSSSAVDSAPNSASRYVVGQTDLSSDELSPDSFSSLDLSAGTVLPSEQEILKELEAEEKMNQKKVHGLSGTSSSSIKNSNSLFGKIFALLKNPWNIAFLVLLFVGLLVRMKYINQESLWNDAAVHLWYAIKVTLDPLFMFSREYLLGDYTIPQTVMALFYLFTKNILLAGKLTTLLFSLVGIVFIYLLAKELMSRFAGLLAAALLIFNHIVWFYGSRPLADSPLLTVTIIMLYCVVKLEKERSLFWGIAAGCMFLAAMLTKVQAMLFSLAFILYFILFRRKEMLKEKAFLYAWLIPAGSLLLAHVIGKLVFNASILDRVFRLFLDMRGMPFGFEAFGMIRWIFSNYLLILAGLGLALILFYKKREYYFPLTLFAFYYLFFEINVDNTQDRYVLPLLTVGIIVAVFALEEMRYFVRMFLQEKNRTFVGYALPLILVFFLCYSYYSTGDALNYNKSFSYTGYQEAGEWLKQNVPPDAPIFAGEYRSIRLFVEREYGGPAGEDLGGTVWNLRSPYRYTEEHTADGKRNFEADVAALSQESDVYLEIDVWEYAQPSWYWPLTQDSFTHFFSLGFKVVKVVERDVLTKEGIQKVPVIFILKKDQASSLPAVS